MELSEKLVLMLREYRTTRHAMAALLLAITPKGNEEELIEQLEICTNNLHATSKSHSNPQVVNLMRDVAILADDVLPAIKSFVQRQS
jgi:hypothetical protein